MPAAEHFILATAGHVDHGKSALVRALTGSEPDRLPEEKTRGVTIELGFAHFSLEREGRDFDVGVIDVPGHEDFVRNMVAGVGAIDVALLVVAADDGWMPQTEEHLQILTYLGVQRGVVALTKVDLVEDASLVETSIRSRLANSPLASSAIVRTSVKRGMGLDALRAALADALDRATPRANVGKPRLAIDRAFSPRGVGTVVTGTLIGGTFAPGDSIVVRPGDSAARIRLAQTHGREVNVARPGSRVALNVPDLKVGETVRRGDVITLPNVGVVSTRADVLIVRSSRTADAATIPSGLRVVVHHGAATSFATVRTFDRAPVSAGTSALARLSLERPLLLLVGERLLIRDSSQRTTLAGAVVLDASPPCTKRDDSAQRSLLACRARDGSIDATIASQVTRDGVVNADAFDRSLNASVADINDAIDAGIPRGAWRRAGPAIVDAAAWRSVAIAVAAAVDAHHAAHPEHAGASLTAVRSVVSVHTAGEAIFDAVVDELAVGDFARSGAMLRRRTHRAALPFRLRAAGKAIAATLEARPFDPPSRKELAPIDESIQALRFMIADGSVVDIGPDVVMSDNAYRAAASRVSEFLQAQGGATVSELKQLLGSSRRVVVPLLEHLDRDGVTRRVGDRREPGPGGSDALPGAPATAVTSGNHRIVPRL